jgi:outer membrane protein OmpA-like peptidoglycan-associated protein
MVLQSCLAAETEEHPVIRPYPGSVLAENMSKYEKFGSHEFRFKDEATGKSGKKTVKGRHWNLLYEVRTPSGDRVRDITRLEFFENFKQAAAEKGGKTVYEDQVYLVFTLPRDDGGLTWCQINTNAGLGQVYMNIVDEEGFEKSLTFGPDQLRDALEKDGKVILYGILFDLDKASLKQDSDKQLQHIVTLLINNPDLKLEIQGHTDDQGSADYNLDLSMRRAETVESYLSLFGIEPGRLVARGYGETQPVASNDTEEGRAENRRVELVKIR